MSFQNKIEEIRGMGESFSVCRLTEYVLSHPMFSICTGSLENKHHYGDGGLQYHTWEVIKLCIDNAEFFEKSGHIIDKKTLFLSALFHDFGKIWDYASDGKGNWIPTPHKREIHHISRSAIEWSKAAQQFNYFDDDKVLHCILSHHGQREWGSPVSPKSAEAWILFLCDGLSARVTDCGRIDLLGKVKNV